jgi:hypothetical protein
MTRASFSYSESDEIIYCKRCGQIAGSPTECTGGYTSHNFARTQEALVCIRCGATIGQATMCTGGYSSHDFRKIG